MRAVIRLFGGWRGARVLASNATWSLADQGVASLGTLIVAVLVARSSGVEGFGAFAIAFTVYSLILSSSRAFVSMPYMMSSSTPREPRDARSLASGTVGAAFIVGTGVMLACLPVSALMDGSLRKYLLLLAAALPALLLQDAYRFILLQLSSARAVAINDCVWTSCQCLLSVVVAFVGGDNAVLYFAAWSYGSAVAVLTAASQSQIWPSVRCGWRFLLANKQTGGSLVVESVAISGSGQIAQFAIATAGGLSAVAPLRGAAVLLGPVSVATGGLLFFATPIMLKTDTRDTRLLLLRCGLFGAVVAAVGIFSGLLLVVVPDDIGTHVLGATWGESQSTLMPVALALAAGGMQTAAMLGFRAYRVVTKTMILRLATFPIPAIAGITGYWMWDVNGAAWGLAATSIAVAVLLWSTLLRHAAGHAARASDGNSKDR